MKTVPLSEFRRRCSALLKLVKRTHERIQITRFGRPLAEIRPPGLSAEERAARDARDLEILNRMADELNAEALDALEDQADLSFDEKTKRKAGKKKKGRRR